MIARVVALLATLVLAGLLTPWITIWARSAATDMRILLSVLLLAPPAFCMGMMFPIGLGKWRGHAELLPFFWSANGITSMLASVLGVAVSIEFGIANTYALGVFCYVVCVSMLALSRSASSSEGDTSGTMAVAPSIQPTQTELAANVPAKSARADELA